ncbi:MAG: hypothetical protein LBU04_05005 [Christensenellaceae bacterium]|jgi:ferredoxin|nr:hypothetical protein [Christensenellaceae bacterium]
MKITKLPETTSLKEHLLHLGYRFPCDGRGLCGKCKIVAPVLPITSLDRRFIQEIDLLNGVRLACDKSITSDIDIKCDLLKNEPLKRITAPSLVGMFNPSFVELAIIDDELVESKHFPLVSDTCLELRSVIAKNAVDFFEEYGAAKATTLLIAGSPMQVATFLNEPFVPSIVGEFILASNARMPAEQIYVPPAPNKIIGSRHLLEITRLNIDEMIIIPDEGIFIYNNAGIDLVSAKIEIANLTELFNSGTQSDLINIFIASYIYMIQDYHISSVSILSDSFKIERLPRIGNESVRLVKSVAMTAATNVILDNLFKTKLNKLAKRIVYLDIIQQDAFHSILSKL